MFDLIIAAAGESTRFGAEKNKLLQITDGKTVIENSIRPFYGVEGLGRVIIAASEGIFDEVSVIARRLGKNITVCLGGENRTQSVKKALKYVSADYVLIHDGARPFVTEKIIADVLHGAQEKGAAVPLIPLTDSVADISDGYVPLDRTSLCAVQTPQGFRTQLIKSAYDGITDNYTDDVAVYLTKYDSVSKVTGDTRNKKITVLDDLCAKPCRIGFGYDTHLLVPGRRLILGGVDIPFEKGLLGHSDADVLTHAVMDALLSAAGFRDIGYYFPDSDEKYDNADSMILLETVMNKIKNEGYSVNNLAVTVVAEQPKLSPYIPDIVARIATALSVVNSDVAVLATTTEGTGAEGEGRAISAFANVSLIR